MKIQSDLIIKASIIVVMTLTLSGCGGGGGGGGGSQGPAPTPVNPIKATPITIDYAGTVPLINNNPTSSVIYVRNNTDRTINNITYEAFGPQTDISSRFSKDHIGINNKGLKRTNSQFLNPISASQCSTIVANGSCPLSFTTPLLSSFATQGSTVIVAKYDDGGKPGMFSQVVNYADVASDSLGGVQIMSGGGIVGYGNNIGYTTVYIYGTGINQNFLVKSLTTSKANTAIVNGNVVGSTIQSGFVQAVEVSGQISDNTYTVGLDLQSVNQQSAAVFNSQADILVFSPLGEPYLVVGLISVIDYAESFANRYPLDIVNTSNSNISAAQVVASNNVTIDPQSLCSTIPANGMCTVYFSVPSTPGSGVITASGNAVVGTSIIPTSSSQSLTWFNSESGLGLGMIATPNPVSFVAGDSVSGNVKIDITNFGKYDVESIDVSSINVISGSANASLVADVTDTCSGAKIPAQTGVCAYHIHVTDSKAENGAINVTIKGKYKISPTSFVDYSRAIVVNYTSIPNSPAITISKISDMQVNGNNKDITSQSVQIVNNGNVSANISNITLNNDGESTGIRIADATVCSNKTLAVNESCTLAINLGPVNNTTTTPLRSIANLSVPYSGGSIITPVNVLSNNFNAIVNPTGQNLIITSINARSSESGTGVSGDPYIFKGSNGALNKAILVTYQNAGSHQIKISGFNYSISPIFWSVSNGCTGILNPSDTCVMTFNNILASSILAVTNVGSSYNMTFNLPSIFFDDLQSRATYNVTPSYQNANDVQVISRQATMINSVTLESDILTVSHRLSNASGYASGNIQVSAGMESYYIIANPSSSAECQVTPSRDETVVQSCSFSNIDSDGNETLSVAYDLDNQLASDMQLHISFDASPATGMVFSMTPQEIIFNIPNLK